MNKLDTVRLDNGLTIYLYNDKRKHSTFFQFNTYCGGMTKHFIYNDKEYSLSDGVAHILEHYIVECNSKGNFLNELGNKQMATNASTSIYTTSYYFETVENIEFGIRTMLEGINTITFDKDKLENLKNPIFQEIRGKQDNKFYHANRRRMNNLFIDIDFRDIGGTLEEVEAVTIDDLKVLYKAFYNPKNQFIVIAGSFNKKEVLRVINDFYKNIKFDEFKTKLIPYSNDIHVNKKDDEFSFLSPTKYVEICFKIDTNNCVGSELLKMDFYLNTFINDNFSITSKLHEKLKDKKIIVDYIYPHATTLKNCYIINIGAYTYDAEEFKKEILNEIKNKELDQEQFELDKNVAIMGIILRDENIFKMIIPFINNIIYFDYPYLDVVDDVSKLSFKEYKETINKIDFSNYSILTINPK